MKYINYRKFLAVGLSLAGLFFSTQTFAAGCYDSGDPNTYVTPYGGSDLSCPAGYDECTVTFKNGKVTQGENCDAMGILTDVLITGGIFWELEEGTILGMDSEMTNSAQGGKGCLYTHGTDAREGLIGYATNPESDGDFFPATKAVFCADDVKEVTAIVPEPAVVEQCVINGGESKEIFGVTFNCPLVPVGETRTIIVTEDTTDCVDTLETDSNGFPIYECTPVPDFGFLDLDGNIDFNNVCQCVGPLVTNGGTTDIAPILKTECDPDPANTEGGCKVGADSEVAVDISLQNPKCFTVGGFRRCY